MNVRQVLLKNFRNHDATEVEFGTGINALLGNNGQGKTNILEAVSYLSLTKSFYAATDATVLQMGKDSFEVEGRIEADAGTENTIRVSYVRGAAEKEFRVNGVRPETVASVIGRFPIVILSAEKNAITFGGPAERRKFIDLLLSQIYRAYFDDLLEYRRALRQRNTLLMDAKLGRNLPTDILEPWTQSVTNYGSRIIQYRQAFVDEFEAYVKRAYGDLVRNHEVPGLAYETNTSIDRRWDTYTISQSLAEKLAARRSEELQRGTTLVGPHRDDLVLTINGTSVQRYASQGQHKTLLVALKVAEFFYLAERRDEKPIFLLDDVFSELDEHRSRCLLKQVSGLGQTISTSTDETVFRNSVTWNEVNRKFYVEAGKCRPC